MTTLWSAGRYEAVAERIGPIAVQTVEAAERQRPLAGCALVDLACGTGTAALAAAARGAQVTGVDLTPALLEIAAAKAAAGGQSVRWVGADAADTADGPAGAADADSEDGAAGRTGDDSPGDGGEGRDDRRGRRGRRRPWFRF